MPKTGVYSEVEDPSTKKEEREKHFMDAYILPDFPKVDLINPTTVLKSTMEEVRRERTIYRAKYIPIDSLFTKDQLDDLNREFSSAASFERKINIINVEAILATMGFHIDGIYIKKLIIFFYFKGK